MSNELQLNLGPYLLQTITTDRFRLDGGAMFGSVPKTLWSRQIPADEKNRIQLCTRLITLQPTAPADQSKMIVVDMGMGTKWGDKEREIYAIEHLSSIPTPSDIILTHLHFDHCGGISTLTPTGATLTFPAAQIYISEKNLRHGLNPGVRERASYLPENIQPLLGGSVTKTFDGQEIFPGITMHEVNGHTHGMVYVKIVGSSETFVYPADLIPTAHHIQIPYVMGYDLNAEVAMAEKARFLEQAWKEGWIIIFEHDADTPAVRITGYDRGKFTFEGYPV